MVLKLVRIIVFGPSIYDSGYFRAAVTPKAPEGAAMKCQLTTCWPLWVSRGSVLLGWFRVGIL